MNIAVLIKCYLLNTQKLHASPEPISRSQLFRVNKSCTGKPRKFQGKEPAMELCFTKSRTPLHQVFPCESSYYGDIFGTKYSRMD